MIPINSELFKLLEEIYQGHLTQASQNKQHQMGPPAIHRGRALLDRVVAAEENLKQKEGLKDMWPIVKQAREASYNQAISSDGVVETII